MLDKLREGGFKDFGSRGDFEFHVDKTSYKYIAHASDLRGLRWFRVEYSYNHHLRTDLDEIRSIYESVLGRMDK